MQSAHRDQLFQLVLSEESGCCCLNVCYGGLRSCVSVSALLAVCHVLVSLSWLYFCLASCSEDIIYYMLIPLVGGILLEVCSQQGAFENKRHMYQEQIWNKIFKSFKGKQKFFLCLFPFLLLGITGWHHSRIKGEHSCSNTNIWNTREKKLYRTWLAKEIAFWIYASFTEVCYITDLASGRSFISFLSKHDFRNKRPVEISW